MGSTATGARARGTYFGWYIVAAGFLAQFIAVGIQVYMNGVFLTPMTEDLSWSRADYTWALTIGQVVAAFTGFAIGSYIDRHGGRRLMFAGTAISVIGLLLIAESTELWQWLLLRGLVFAAGVALFGNLVVQVTLSKWFVDYRGRAIGIAGVGLSLGGVVLIPPMTAFVDAYGWEAGWRLLALLTALVMPAGYFMRRQPGRLRATPGRVHGGGPAPRRGRPGGGGPGELADPRRGGAHRGLLHGDPSLRDRRRGQRHLATPDHPFSHRLWAQPAPPLR